MEIQKISILTLPHQQQRNGSQKYLAVQSYLQTLELALRYSQGHKSIHADLITSPGKTDAFLNHMIRSLQRFSDAAEADQPSAEQIVLIDTVSSIMTGWKMMTVANNHSSTLNEHTFILMPRLLPSTNTNYCATISGKISASEIEKVPHIETSKEDIKPQDNINVAATVLLR